MPDSSPGSAGPRTDPRTSIAERAARIRFRRALSLMAMTLVAPGSAQLTAGDRRVGRAALYTWLAFWVVALTVLVAVAVDPELVFTLASSTLLLLVLRLLLLVGAVAWAVLFMDAWRLGQPLSLGLSHRRAIVGLNGVLCLGVAGSLLAGAHVVGVQRDLILTMFGSGEAVAAHHGRYNVLLMGGDSQTGRFGMRPDSLTVASIDEVTGRTVLISLPRNMTSFPFAEGSVMAEEFPDGFDVDMLNGVSTWATDHPELFVDSEDPGIDATISAVEGITGLGINYWAMVNLQGFKDLVDAVGGIELTVRQPIPVGLPHEDFFHYLEPGTRRLNGFETLWYARARHDSDDYSRMARQKCVMNAMLQQVSPQVALRNFEQIAAASSELVSTDLPAGELDTFLSLALKARAQKISTLSLVPPLVDTADPDVDAIHAKVAQTIAKADGTAEAAPKKKPKKKAGDGPVTGGSLGSLSEGYEANQAGDLSTAC